MRKILGFLFLAAAVGFVAGCTSSTPEIRSITEVGDIPTIEAEVDLDLSTLPSIEGTVRYEYSTVPQPEGLTLQGTVYGETRGHLITGNPLEGVTLYISGNSLTRVTTTDANGEYSFTGLSQNPEDSAVDYQIVASLDGWQTRRIDAPIDSDNTLPDNTIAVLDILMLDSPIVLSIDPIPGATIEAGEPLSITVEFNEAMDPSTVAPWFMNAGIRTYAIEDTVALNTSWSPDGRVLTIETVGDLLPNMFYRFQLDPGATARDTREFPLDTSGGGYDLLFDVVGGGLTADEYNMTTADLRYRTASGNIVGQPSNVQLKVNNQFSQDLDYADLSVWTNPVELNWLPATSGAISGYRVYVASSLTGPWFEMGGTIEDNHVAYTILQVASTLGIVDFEPVTRRDAPFINYPVFFRVAAYNAEDENASVAVSAGDVTGPEFDDDFSDTGGNLLSNGYVLPDVSGDDSLTYVTFNEPVNLAEAGNAGNYSLSGGGVVQSAVPITSSQDNLGLGGGGNYTVVLIDAEGAFDISALSGVTLTVSDNVTDLAGNEMGDGAGDTITF